MAQRQNVSRAVERLYHHLGSAEELSQLTRQDIRRIEGGCYAIFEVPVRDGAVNNAITYLLTMWCASNPRSPLVPWWPRATEAMPPDHIMRLLDLDKISNDTTIAQLLLFWDWCRQHAKPDRQNDASAVADMIESADPATGSPAWKAWTSFLQRLRSPPAADPVVPAPTPDPPIPQQPTAKALPAKSPPAHNKVRRHTPSKAKRGSRTMATPENSRRKGAGEIADKNVRLQEQLQERNKGGVTDLPTVQDTEVVTASISTELTVDKILEQSPNSPIMAVWPEWGPTRTVPSCIYAILGPDAGNYLGAEYLRTDDIFQVVLGKNVMTGKQTRPCLDDGWYVRCCYTKDRKSHRLIRLVTPYQVHAAEYLRRYTRGALLFNRDLSGPVLTWGLRGSQYPIIGRLEGEPNQ